MSGYDELAAAVADPRFDGLILMARETNAERDAVDRAAGFATPDQGPLWQQLDVICSAIEAGLRMRDANPVAEGLVMLQDAVRRLRGQTG